VFRIQAFGHVAHSSLIKEVWRYWYQYLHSNVKTESATEIFFHCTVLCNEQSSFRIQKQLQNVWPEKDNYWRREVQKLHMQLVIC